MANSKGGLQNPWSARNPVRKPFTRSLMKKLRPTRANNFSKVIQVMAS